MRGEQLTTTQDREPEQEALIRPRIFVASLAAYQEGELRGGWVDAAVHVADLHAAVDAALGRGPEDSPVEYFIHDHQNFAGLDLSRAAPLSFVANVAEGIREHGPPFAHWARLVGNQEGILAAFTSHYFGYWPNLTSWAVEFARDLGLAQEVAQLSAAFQTYLRFDYDGFVSDMAATGELDWSEDDGGVHIFLTPWRQGASDG